MPPKPKFTQEQIIEAGLQIAENKGLEYLTARNLGEILGSSARPIFTAFNSMEEVIDKVKQKADEIYTDYINEGLKEPLPFKGVGMAYIRFATERPKLFRMMFMNEHKNVLDMRSVLRGIESNYDKILSSIRDNYDLSDDVAQKLYLQIWIYSHGIATLIATRVCVFSMNEISQMITDVFKSLLIRAKSGELQ